MDETGGSGTREDVRVVRGTVVTTTTNRLV